MQGNKSSSQERRIVAGVDRMVPGSAQLPARSRAYSWWRLVRVVVLLAVMVVATLVVAPSPAVAELPVLIEKLRDSLTRRDAKNLEFAGHKLKGALRPFGAQRPYGLAIKLMNMGKDGELEGAEQLVEQLEPDVCDVVKILRAFLDRDPKG